MVPVYEQGKRQGIGYSVRSFGERFESLCREHLERHQARAFAFIFYNPCDQNFRRILNNQGAFAELDRLSGTNLSIFYLCSAKKRSVKKFNTQFLDRLGVSDQVGFPCVVFFRIQENGIDKVTTVQLENADLIHGLHELYSVFEAYINNEVCVSIEGSKYIKWAKVGSRFISIEMFRAWFKNVLEDLI